MPNRIALDTGPLSLLCHSNRHDPGSVAINRWAREQLVQGGEIFICEVADYELRRELIRAGKLNALRRLDEAGRHFKYLPITTEVMRDAAAQWAAARSQGQPTADPKELDGDVILAAQAASVGAVIATTNVGHLGRFVIAKRWQDIL